MKAKHRMGKVEGKIKRANKVDGNKKQSVEDKANGRATVLLNHYICVHNDWEKNYIF